MNDNFLTIFLTRIRILEESVMDIQEKIRGAYLQGYINGDGYPKQGLHKECVSNDNDICVLEVDDGTDIVQNRFNHSGLNDIKILTAISKSTINKSRTKKEGTIKMNESKTYKTIPTCLMKMKHNWLYNVLWVTVNIFGIVVSYIYIMNAYGSWQSSPVVQVLSNSQVHLDNISFPAVTICWPNSFKKGYDFISNIEQCVDCVEDICGLKNTTCNYTDVATLVLVKLMCEKYFLANPLPKNIFENIPQGINKSEFDMYMNKLLPSCESDVVLTKRSYGNEPPKQYTRCNGDVFQQFYSSFSNGLCMTYNSLRHKDIYKENVVTPMPLATEAARKPQQETLTWSFDNMMEFKGDRNTVPIYGLDGLVIAIYKRVRRYKRSCNILAKDIGFIIVHSPNEIPLHFDSAFGYSVGYNVATEIMVVPKITLAGADLAQYLSHLRGCLFTHESNLTMFKFYTKNNCDLECLVNTYLKTCGCVPYNYPRQNSSVKVCMQDCAQPKYRCNCLPDCNYLSYDISFQESSIAGLIPNNTIPVTIEIKLKERKFYTTIRYSISSHAEFLAYSFGVLGAFIGFSVTCVWKTLYSGIKNLCTFFRA